MLAECLAQRQFHHDMGGAVGFEKVVDAHDEIGKLDEGEGSKEGAGTEE